MRVRIRGIPLSGAILNVLRMALQIAKSCFRKLRTLRSLAASERSFALATILLMAFTRLALWTLPFRWIKRFVETRQPGRFATAPYTEQRVVWAVRLASRYVPRATCLTQALAAQMLLSRAGFNGKLHIGVRKQEQFTAHAWVECAGHVVVGGTEEAATYTRMLTLQ
jgi:hypothetical protein